MSPRARALALASAVLVAGLAGLALERADAVFSDRTDNSNSLEAGDWYRLSSVAAGREFACTSNVNDEVSCWGKGGDGQLGDGTGTDSTTPVRVVGAGGSGYLLGVAQVVAGETFACGRKDDGSVWCWGRNDKGQLGNNTTSSSDWPVQVIGVGGSGFLSSVVDIAAGQKHACAATSSGNAYCWGENNVGQLGDGTGANSSTPVQVVGLGGSGTLSGITDVGSGMDHACAVGSGGAVYCWGEGSDGQLGNAAASDMDWPVQVTGVGGSGTLSGAEEVDGGDKHTCAGTTAGALYCWGKNDNNQLSPGTSGDGTVVWKRDGDSSPYQAVYAGGSLGTASKTVDVGKWRIIQGAVSTDGSEAIVIGVDDGEKIAAQRWTGSAWEAPPFNDLATVTDSFWWGFDVAYESASGDAVLVWNNGSTGTAGLSYRVWDGASWSGESTITAPVGGEPKQLQLAAAPDDDGITLVVSTGSADYAVFWDGSAWSSSAVLSTTPDNLTEVNVAYEQQSGDAIVVYGHSSDEMYYRVWDGSSLSGETAIPVPSGTSTSSSSLWSAIATDAGSDRIVLGVTNGALDGWVAIWDGSSWGDKLTVTNSGSGTNHPWIAVAFEGLSGDALVVYGESNQYVRYRTWPAGSSWGGEPDGPDMGAGQYVNSVVLYPRQGSDEVMMVGQDDDSDLELELWSGTAWGGHAQPSTNTGEVKNQPFVFLWDVVGDTGPPPSASTSPLQVGGPDGAGLMSGVAHIGTGSTFTCAALDSGAAYCWGRNDKGQLGDNTTTDRDVPTRVVGSGGTGAFGDAGLLSGADSTGTFTCATRTDPALSANPARRDEELWCWGRNDQGQLGDGTKTDRDHPEQVSGL